MSDVESRILSISGGTVFKEETLTKPVPTVFIALGGSGKDVVMRLRKRFFDRFHTKDPGYARFVFIDTDTQKFVPKEEKAESFAELQPNQNEMVACPITSAQFHRVFSDLRARVNCDHLAWLKQEMERVGAQSVEHGAGTHRQMGRLAFYLNYAAIRHTIQRQIDEILRFAADNPNSVEENRIEVVIVMSLAGGTGAGMFIDVAYLVQDILGLPNYRTLKGKSVTLIAFLPGMFDHQKDLLPRFQQNAFAAFMELEYYGTPRTGDELFLGEHRNGARQERHWTGFLANWGDGNKRFIRGPGWDTCFLIDNRNDLDPNAPLLDREVFQMAADYLFLDFENHEFAIAKRSARSNLVQYKDKVKETWVRRPDDPNALVSIYEGNSVYATQNGCRFSSFGLAEIYFDVERLYQIAAYRLAGLLVRRRWLGSADSYPESQYIQWVKEHLLQPKGKADQEVPPSFLPESLTRRLLTGSSGCRLDELKRDMDGLAEIDPDASLERLTRVLSTHAGSLREGSRGDNGAARLTLQENLTRLSGDAINLGPLRDRVRQLAAAHCGQYGVAVTLRLLEKYRGALNQVREKARVQAEASPPDDAHLLARLKEAQMVPWPVHDTALAIEANRTHVGVGKALQLRYDKAAATAIDNLLRDVSRYIGAPDQTSYSVLARHGTLHGYYTRAQNFLKTLAERLEERFKVTIGDDKPKIDEQPKPGAVQQKPRVTRRYSLSPSWDEATFEKRIDEALVGHPEISKAEGPSDKFSFDWARLEALVLQHLRSSPRADLGDAMNVDDLIKHCIENRQDNAEGIVQVADLLADSCKVALHGAKDSSGMDAGGFQLKDEEDGNAVDLLVRRADWTDVLEKMVKASMPYFQTTDPTRISNDFSPAYSNLYSQKQGESNPKVSAKNAARVFDKVKEIVASRGQSSSSVAARMIDRPLAAENSAIILVREMTGFPLQFYAHLDSLRAAYDNTKTVTLKNDECHINFNEASEDLPDITLLETDTYALIRENVSNVIRAIILQAINWKDGVLKVAVPDKHGTGAIEMRLGSRLHRAIKYACEKERVRQYLARFWNEWANRASPRDWACLYASGRMTWTQLNPERDIRQGDVSSPLRNCYDGLLAQVTKNLKASEEGQRWLRALESDPFEERPFDGSADGAENEPLARKIVRTCLRRLNPEIPIYQVIADKVSDIDPPR
jgi:hypothetical protein